MSYILDALKKAERERGIAQVPTLATVHELRAAPQVRKWIIPGVLVLAAAAAVWFLVSISGRHVATESAPAMESGSAAPARAPEAAAPETAALETAGPSAGASISAPKALVPAPAVDSRKSPPRVTEQTRVLEDPRPAQTPRPAAVARPIWDQPEVMQSRPAPGDFDDETPAANPEKPMSLREAVARMSMTMHMFSEMKGERLVFINGRKYVEGEAVEGRYLLEQITAEGAVLSYGSERAVLRPGTK